MKKIYNKRIVTLFILFQPFIDVLTYFSNSYFGFSVGILCRGLFLVYALLYLFFFSEHKKTNLFFLLLIAMYIIFYLFFNCYNFNIFIYKIPSLFKFIYFPIMTLFFYDNRTIEIKRNLLLVTAFVCILMIISQLFGNVVLSYESSKLGNSGWFFSSNEFSSITSILFPLIFVYFIERINKIGFLFTILLIISMLLIGTKTAYLAIPITLASFTVYFLYKIFIKKIDYKKQLLITCLLFIIYMLITPFTYAYKNIYIQGAKNFDDLVLNGRDRIKDNNLVNIINDSPKKGDKFSIMFGISLTEKRSYEFERDFYNIYYNYGIFGMLIYFIIPLYILVIALKKKKKLSNIHLNCTKCAAAISLMISLGVAYISGHTLLAPAVCIYISLFGIILIQDNNFAGKKKVLFISSVGGHLTQMLELKEIFNDYNYLLVTEKTSVTIGMKDKYNMSFLIYGSRKYIIKYLFIFMFNIFKSLYLFLKYTPDVIITTGTHTAVPMCYIGWLFNKKIIYIESFAKRTSPTLTGRIVYPIATTFVVQWKSMLKYYPKAKYWGGIY